MTHIISAITKDSILMASDSRLNYHNTEKDQDTGDTYQVIVATADCIRKTFFLEKINIGIQFIGIGYFNKGNEKYPLNAFMEFIQQDIKEEEEIHTKFRKVFENLKQLTEVGNTGQYVNGVMTGYRKEFPYICTFNTYTNNVDFNSYEIGAYVESTPTSENRPVERQHSITYINNRIAKLSNERPHDIGGPIEILEIKPNGEGIWIQQNENLFHGTLTDLINCWQNTPEQINGKILESPVRQKMDV